jgi:hypothetical protein
VTRTLITLEVGGEQLPTIQPRINGAYVTPDGDWQATACGLQPISSFLDHLLLDRWPGPAARRWG